MKKGFEMGGKYAQDPVGSESSRGKSRERRKHRNDGPTLTPTETHIKSQLMNQFRRTGEGPGGNSPEYISNYERTFGHE